MLEQSDFISLYQNLKIDIEKPLRQVCPSRNLCWPEGIDTENGYGITDPFIGKYYDQHKILFVAMNFRGFGEIDGFGILIEPEMDNPDFVGVTEQLLAGKMKVFKSEDYGGTMLFYGIAATAACLLQNMEHEKFRMPADKSVAPAPAELADAFNYISIVQLVKCSPDEQNRNNPYSNMFIECPKLLLSKELDLLKPEIIVLLGDSVYYSFPGIDNFKEQYRNDYVWKYENDKKQKLLSVYHPAANNMQSAANREKYFKELRELKI